MSDNLEDCSESYIKMRVLREVAKKIPDSNLIFILKTLDKVWDEEIKKLKPPKKKSKFVTKF